jgi:hypothetical protein
MVHDWCHGALKRGSPALLVIPDASIVGFAQPEFS